jgi:hypothetical protein
MARHSEVREVGVEAAVYNCITVCYSSHKSWGKPMHVLGEVGLRVIGSERRIDRRP